MGPSLVVLEYLCTRLINYYESRHLVHFVFQSLTEKENWPFLIHLRVDRFPVFSLYSSSCFWRRKPGNGMIATFPLFVLSGANDRRTRRYICKEESTCVSSTRIHYLKIVQCKNVCLSLSFCKLWTKIHFGLLSSICFVWQRLEM